MNRGLRHCLLRLLEAVLTPRCAHTDEQASIAAHANATAFVEAGGVQLAVDLVAGTASALMKLQMALIYCQADTAQQVLAYSQHLQRGSKGRSLHLLSASAYKWGGN